MSKPGAVTTYEVWRRDDGYVAASAYTGRPCPDHSDGKPYFIHGVQMLEQLLVTTNWTEAKERIAKERGIL